MEKVFLAIKFTAAFICFLLMIGLGIGSLKVTPDYAEVYVNDAVKTYLAPPCITAAVGLRAITAGEARRLGYRPDSKCRDEGSFTQDDRSLTGKLFQKIGILKPIPSRWNKDGSWNY